MKKLLITTMAAVSVGLCAKAADDGFISGTSFEGLAAGVQLNAGYDDNGTEAGEKFWTYEASGDDLFTVTNASIYVGFDTYQTVSHPTQWGVTEKVLAIDTAAPILRNANAYSGETAPAQNVSTPVFFDSVVQFTATDVAPVIDLSNDAGNKDKLIVWLYSSPEDVSAENPGALGETEAVTNLVITAGRLNGETLVQENYLTDYEITPETWHRLTIKSFIDNNEDSATYARLVFNVWIDGQSEPISVKGVTDFLSLVPALNDKTLQGVAFDGKGAVDDIVFTTTDPLYVPPAEAETYAIVATGDNAQITFSSDEEGNVPLDDVSALDVTTTTVYGYVIPLEGYEVTSAKFNGSDLVVPDFDGVGYNFLLPIGTPKNGDEYAFVVTVTETTGGGSGEEPEVPATPTIGGEGVKDADAFIAAANSGVTIKVPTDWTLDGNTLKDADGKEYATFADYYTVTLATDGTVTLELNDNAKPEIDETAADKGDAIVVTETEVALGVTNAKVGLWYGVQAYSDAACTTKIGDEPTGWEKATDTTVTVTVVKPDAGTAFFKVVVDDQDHTPAEEQN